MKDKVGAALKTKVLKADIKKWNNDVYERLEERKKCWKNSYCRIMTI